MDEIEILKQQIAQLQSEFNSLKSFSTIPFEVRTAILELIGQVTGQPSTKTAASETQAVNEGGSASYDVAKPMDGFIVVIVNNIPRKVPYYE